MKKITILAITIIFIGSINYKYGLFSMVSSSSSSPQKVEDLFPSVKKINDNLYVGKVADEFYLAMEKIDQKNIDMWLKYAKKQETTIKKWRLDFAPTIEGVTHFELVLNDYKSGKIKPQNEIWVAYASSTPVTQMANLANDSNPTIEMYVTVATSPEALITSHMGISRSWEAALDLQQKPSLRTKHPNQSIHLHSFAAKVMKLRDPKKVYMLTAPVIIMRDIIIKQMPPDSVFVGDNIYQEKLESIEKDPKILLHESTLREKKETALEREARLKRATDYMYKNSEIAKKIALLTTNPPRITRVEESQNQKLIIPAPDGKSLISFDQSSPIYQWLFTAAYTPKYIFTPYTLIDLDKLAKITPLQINIPEKEKV